MRWGIATILVGCCAAFSAAAQDRNEPEWYRDEDNRTAAPLEPAPRPVNGSSQLTSRGYPPVSGSDARRLDEERVARARQLIFQREAVLAKQRAARLAMRNAPRSNSLRYFQDAAFSVSSRTR